MKKREKWARKGVCLSQQDPRKSKGHHMRMPSSFGPTLQHKNLPLPGSTQPCPRVSMQKPRHNPHPLQALRSLNLAAPAYRKQEEYSSFFPSLCCSTLFSICSHAYKGTHLASPILHHRAHGACHQDPGFLHTSRVCDPALLSPESAWSMCPPLF